MPNFLLFSLLFNNYIFLLFSLLFLKTKVHVFKGKKKGKNVYFANVNDQSQSFLVERSLTVLIKHVKHTGM